MYTSRALNFVISRSIRDEKSDSLSRPEAKRGIFKIPPPRCTQGRNDMSEGVEMTFFQNISPVYYEASGIYRLRVKSATMALTKFSPPITKLTRIIPNKGIKMAVTSNAPTAEPIRSTP